MRRRSRRGLVMLLAVLIGSALAGCAAPRPSEPPARVAVSVFQYRDDFATRRIEIEVTNKEKRDLVVTGLTFSTPYFAKAVTVTGLPYTVVGGGTTDFAMPAPAPACAASEAEATASLTYRGEDGKAITVRPKPTLPFTSLATLHAQDCGQQAFEDVAKITVAPSLRFEQHHGKPVAVLDLTFTPTGASGTATLISITGTPLLVQTEGEIRTFDRTFSAATAPTTIPLHFAPIRCGTHVLAEDKIGTLIPFHVRAGGFSDAFFRIPVSLKVKGQFYNWVGRYCGQ